jgi:hypothetical protein
MVCPCVHGGAVVGAGSDVRWCELQPEIDEPAAASAGDAASLPVGTAPGDSDEDEKHAVDQNADKFEDVPEDEEGVDGHEDEDEDEDDEGMISTHLVMSGSAARALLSRNV